MKWYEMKWKSDPGPAVASRRSEGSSGGPVRLNLGFSPPVIAQFLQVCHLFPPIRPSAFPAPRRRLGVRLCALVTRLCPEGCVAKFSAHPRMNETSSVHTISKRGQRPGLVGVGGGGSSLSLEGKEMNSHFSSVPLILQKFCFYPRPVSKYMKWIVASTLSNACTVFHIFPHHCLSSCVGFVIVNADPYVNTCYFWFVSVVRSG